MASIYDPLESDVESYQNRFVMSPELWARFDISDLPGVDFSRWQAIKLMNDNGDAFSTAVQQIPSDTGGIYVYSIQPGIIPNCGTYIMYVGRAFKTDSQNLRKRVQAYQKEIGTSYTRERIHRLFFKWGKYVHVYYLPVQKDNDTIKELEKRLISVIVPPCNSEIPIKAVKQAVKAFGY